MLRFDIITEADARTLDIGATVELAAGGHVTPLAKDTLAARRVTVVGPGSRDAGGGGDLVPVGGHPPRRDRQRSHRRGAEAGAGAAPAGPRAGGHRSRHRRHRSRSTIRTSPARSRWRWRAGKRTPALSIDGAGIGSAIAANKVRGIRAAMCPDETIARYSREHNGANVITLGSTLLAGPDAAIRIVDVWLGTAMREERYIRRLAKIKAPGRAGRPGMSHAMLNPQDLQRLIEHHHRGSDRGAGRAADLDALCAATPSATTAAPIGCAAWSMPARPGSACTRPAAAPSGVAGMIDHTLLKPDATRAEIEKLCREAAEFQFATVCVNPVWVAESARLLRGTGVGVCSVVGFPLGATTADVKHYETRRAIFDGALEIDMVINVGALKSGRPPHGRARHRGGGRAVPPVRRRPARSSSRRRCSPTRRRSPPARCRRRRARIS